jgi:cytoskeleton protein RodZ
MRGVSLEEIADSTKIGTRSLRALEDEDFEKLPGGIFNRGFVRAYSRFLGLDEDQTVADFDEAWKEYEAAKRPVQVPEAEEEDTAGESRPLWIIATALALVVLIAAGWYFVRRHSRSTSSEAVMAPRTTVDNSQPATPPLANTSATTPPVTGASQDSTTQTASPAKKPVPSPTPKSASASDSTAGKNSDQPRTAAAEPPPDLNAPIRLEVFAREDSWLSVSADGKNLGQGLLAAQKSRTIRAQKEVRLRLGNVGGVEVSFNGRPVNIDGEPKQVKELTFTPEGLRQ